MFIVCYFDLTQWFILVDSAPSDVYMPLAFITLISYCVSELFMMVYGIGLDTILHCFITDEEIQKSNGGTSAKNTPQTLRDFISTNNFVKSD